MAKFVIEVKDCLHCPCLRRRINGNFYCCYNPFHIIDYENLKVIDEVCPLNTKNKGAVQNGRLDKT